MFCLVIFFCTRLIGRPGRKTPGSQECRFSSAQAAFATVPAGTTGQVFRPKFPFISWFRTKLSALWPPSCRITAFLRICRFSSGAFRQEPADGNRKRDFDYCTWFDFTFLIFGPVSVRRRSRGELSKESRFLREPWGPRTKNVLVFSPLRLYDFNRARIPTR